MYFQKFPQIAYSINQDGQYDFVLDILRRVKIKSSIKENQEVTLPYLIRESDTPESIANKIYGSVNFFWIVLHMNNIYNLVTHWPMHTNQLYDYCVEKYGADAVYATHHYEDADKIWVNSDAPDATVISNYDHEDRLNEAKRSIVLLDPYYVGQIQQEFEKNISLNLDQDRLNG